MKHYAELKWLVHRASAMPVGPTTNAGGSQDLTAGTYGNCFYNTPGQGQPVVIDPFAGVRSVVNMSAQGMIGNKITANRMRGVFRFVCASTLTHAVYRVSVLIPKLKAQTYTTTENYTSWLRSILVGATLTGTSGNEAAWSTLPWDKKQVWVLYDKIKVRNALPIVIADQNAFKFPIVTFRVNKRWKKGLNLQLYSDLANTSAGNRWQRPVILVLQGGSTDVTNSTVLPDMEWGLTTDSSLYISWRDL